MLDIDKIKVLTELDGVPSLENEVFDFLKNELKDTVDSVSRGNNGEFISIKNGKTNRRIMLASHMDEVGFIVSRITEEGFIFMAPVGGWVSNVVLSQKYTITTENGNKIRAISGSVPPHVLSMEERKKVVEIEDIYLDLGVSSKEEVLNLGIEIGDMITPYYEFEVMNNENYLTGKAFDDRIGCAVMASVMQELQNKETNFEIVGVGTTQEEVGCRGAKTSAYEVDPDLAISLDTSVSKDTPGIKESIKTNKMGNGPLLFIIDSSMIVHRGFMKFVKRIAKENDINLQFEFLRGGQDGGMISTSRAGVPTVCISVATRYIHSHAGMIHKKDYEESVKLIVKIIENLNEDTLKEIKGE